MKKEVMGNGVCRRQGQREDADYAEGQREEMIYTGDSQKAENDFKRAEIERAVAAMQHNVIQQAVKMFYSRDKQLEGTF